MATYEELIAKSRELHAAGRKEDAKRVAQIAVNQRGTPKEKPSVMQAIKENLIGDDDPNSQNWGEYIGSALNKAGEAMTFGLIGDEASAAAESALPGVDYASRRDHYRQQEEVLERDNPGTALTAEIAGALLLPGGVAAAAPKAAASGVKALQSGNLASRAGKSALVTGLGGAVYGGAEGEGLEDRAKQAALTGALSGAVGGVIPVAGAGIQKALDQRAFKKGVQSAAKGAPTSAELRSVGGDLYSAIDDADVQIKPESFSDARDAIRSALRSNTGFDELPGPGSLTPKSARVMKIMDQAGDQMAAEPTAALPFRSLDQMRRQAGTAARNFTDESDQAAGMEIISGLDDFVRGLAEDDVVAGDVKLLQDVLPKARDVWARMSRSQLIDDAIEGSEDYLSGGASGIKNQFKRILKNDKLSSGFSEAEKKAMRRVINGTIPEQALSLLGGGMGQLLQVGLGAQSAGLPGAIGGMATGALARKGSEAVARKNAEIVRALVANGGLKDVPKALPHARNVIETLMRPVTAATIQ